MIEALGDPRFYVAFWCCWLLAFGIVLLVAGHWLGGHLRAIHLNLDAIYQELRQLGRL